MEPFDLTPTQLRQAAVIKEKLDDLNKELRMLLDGAYRKTSKIDSVAVLRPGQK